MLIHELLYILIVQNVKNVKVYGIFFQFHHTTSVLSFKSLEGPVKYSLDMIKIFDVHWLVGWGSNIKV